MMKMLSVALCLAAVSAAWSLAPALSQTARSSAGDSAMTVHLKGDAFQPDTVTVKVGETVTFTNDDQVAHNVIAPDKGIDSGDIRPGKSWQYTFTTAGTYDYLCTYHPGMKGELRASSGK